MLNDFQIQAHPASYHVWLTLPEKLTSAKFAAEAQSRGVMISPAEIFAVGKKSPLNAVRLSIGAISSREQLRRGLHILAEILTDTAPRHSVTV